MKTAPIVLIGIGLLPFLIWLAAFGVICLVYRLRMKKAQRDAQRQQLRRLERRDIKVMTIIWAVVGVIVTIGLLVRAFLL